ncbi:MAG: dihydroorotate dehydrogenase electron transfer subunit [Bacteroidaceae bacterium]|nr:dihydroorotate dehydrogenase electron transfer subunit [Bacteroidaceae bacterium]
MRKYQLDLTLKHLSKPRPGYVLLQLTDPSAPLPEMLPGQFVEVRVDSSASTFLRRPISINLVDRQENELWLLVHVVGPGTQAMAELNTGDRLNVVVPLGNGFTLPQRPASEGEPCAEGSSESAVAPRYLLVGGGVGTAPLLYMGQELVRRGCKPTFLLGGRTSSDLLQLDLFGKFGEVFVTTEDGSAGERGFVTQHSLWQTATAEGGARVYDRICTCGPKPMMMAVARLAGEKGIPCEASLENMMACGLGACLCCVEDTRDGHVCVCTEGPVFPTDKLKW